MMVDLIQKIKKLARDKEKLKNFWEIEGPKLDKSQKEELLLVLLDERMPFYDPIPSQITYELAEPTPEFVSLLEKISATNAPHVMNNPLVGIGETKKWALELIELMTASNNDKLIEFSGFVLGGFGKKNPKEMLDYTSNRLGDVGEVEKLSFTRALAIYIHENETLNNETKILIDTLLVEESERIGLELVKTLLINFNLDEKYCYDRIFQLVKRKNDGITCMIFQDLAYGSQNISDEQLLQLIAIGKETHNHEVLNEIVHCFQRISENNSVEIADLVIYFLQLDFEYQPHDLGYVIQGISPNHPKLFKILIEKRMNLDYATRIIQFPKLVILASNQKFDSLLDTLEGITTENPEEMEFVMKCINCIKGNVFQDKNNVGICIRLLKFLERLVADNPNIDTSHFNQIIDKAKNNTENSFILLLDTIQRTIEDSGSIKKSYDFSRIKANLEKYPCIKELFSEYIENLEAGGYHPLIWMLEDEHRADNVFTEDIKGMDEDERWRYITLQRGRLWPRAYLLRLEESLAMLEQYENDKFKKIEDWVKLNMLHRNEFWTSFSELVFLYQCHKAGVLEKLEPRLSNSKWLDCLTKINGKKVFFEITRPEMDRKLRLSTTGCGLGRRAFKKICDKLKKQIRGITEEKEDLFFVVLDVSSSLDMDRYDVLNTFGSLQVAWNVNTETGEQIGEMYLKRADDGIQKRKDSEYLSGAIYFGIDLNYDGKKPEIVLKGEIFDNPIAKNKLDSKERAELKKLLFGESSG